VLDLVIQSGNIIDGSGTPAYSADVGIKGDRIVEIGCLDEVKAAKKINAAGLAVAPGFIDLHTHSDFTLLLNPAAESQVHQGVTLEVLGQCGHSCAPVDSPEICRQSILGHHPAVEISWRSFGQYLDRLEQQALGMNVMAMVGHGTVYRTVMNRKTSAPDAEDIERMKSLVQASLEEGAVGLSTGLEYWPGSDARLEDIQPLVGVVSRYNGLYASHIRNRDRYYDVGLAEALSMARTTGAKLQISHIQPKFGAPAHAMEHCLEMIEWTRQAGSDVAFDVIPHDWAHTKVSAIIPAWAHEGGEEALRSRLADAKQREKMKLNPKPIWLLVPAGRWSDIVLYRSVANKDLVGLTFEEIGRRRQVDPYDAVFDLLLEEGEHIHGLLWTSHNFTENDIKMCLREPSCLVISDTMALAPYGITQGMIGSLSGYGWTARFFQKYVREEKLLSIEDAVHRLTGLAALRLGLRDRGVLRAGALADLVVFDEGRIENRATLEEPARYPLGIEHVIVNGRLALEKGTRTGWNGGRVLRRSG
jgi:N-acyl-D-amino-acid deacylase